MRILKDVILTLCIISFFSLGNMESISAAARFLPRKQANIAFVGFQNSGKTGLRATLAGIDFDFDTYVTTTDREHKLPKGLVLDDGHGHNYAIDCNLWDTSGHPSDKDKIIDSRCKYMDVVVIMVSLGMPNYGEEVSRTVLEWQDKILDQNPNAKIILACTKSDLIRDPAQLRDIATRIDNFIQSRSLLGHEVKCVVVSAKAETNLDVLMQMIGDYLREIGLDNLHEIDYKLPFEDSICLLL